MTTGGGRSRSRCGTSCSVRWAGHSWAASSSASSRHRERAGERSCGVLPTASAALAGPRLGSSPRPGGSRLPRRQGSRGASPPRRRGVPPSLGARPDSWMTACSARSKACRCATTRATGGRRSRSCRRGPLGRRRRGRTSPADPEGWPWRSRRRPSSGSTAAGSSRRSRGGGGRRFPPGLGQQADLVVVADRARCGTDERRRITDLDLTRGTRDGCTGGALLHQAVRGSRGPRDAAGGAQARALLTMRRAPPRPEDVVEDGIAGGPRSSSSCPTAG